MKKRILFVFGFCFLVMGLVACQAEATEVPFELATETVEVSEVEEKPEPTHTPEKPTQPPEPATPCYTKPISRLIDSSSKPDVRLWLHPAPRQRGSCHEYRSIDM